MSTQVMHVVLAGFLTLAATFYASLVEWFVHKVMYHCWFKSQHDHHHAEYSGQRFRQAGSYQSLQPWWFEAVLIAVHAPLFVWIGQWAGAVSGVLTFAAIAVYAALSNYLHTAIHRPCGRWVERTSWYRGLGRRHREHHLEVDVYYNIPLPWADACFRTVGRALRRTTSS